MPVDEYGYRSDNPPCPQCGSRMGYVWVMGGGEACPVCARRKPATSAEQMEHFLGCVGALLAVAVPAALIYGLVAYPALRLLIIIAAVGVLFAAVLLLDLLFGPRYQAGRLGPEERNKMINVVVLIVVPVLVLLALGLIYGWPWSYAGPYFSPPAP